MTLVAGSYERFLFGYGYSQPGEAAAQAQAQPPPLPRHFTHAAHKGVVKCLAAAGQYVASGGADDLIHLYDLKNDKDLGFLMNPGEGAVTALEFFVPAGGYNPTHLLSGSADGSVSVWSVGGGWECMKTMKGHRKEVNALSVHSSGALALSCSRDGTLRMWDLVKGRSTFQTKLEAEAEWVRFSPSGGLYALLCGPRVTLHAIGDAQGLVGELPHPRRALCMAFSPDGSFLATGAEDGSLRVWRTQDSQEVLYIPRAHATRIRGLVLPYSPGPHPAIPGLPALLATAASDGVIKLWDLSRATLAPEGAASAGPQGASCCGEAATKARITSLCALDPPEVMAQRLKAARTARQAAGKEGKPAQPGGQGAAAAGGASAKPAGKGAGKAKDKSYAAALQQGQQGQQGSGKKKRQREAEGAAEGAAQQKAHKKGRPPQQQEHEGQPAKKKKAKAEPQAAEAAPAAGAGGRAEGVSKGGVVDFMDAKDWQRAKQKKKKQRQRAQQAGQGKQVPRPGAAKLKHKQRAQQRGGGGAPKHARA